MPKIITKQIRRKMLAKHDEGDTYTELKRQFGITDTRTLQRHLEKAEREREEREVRIRICTDSQKLHLDEICTLAETFRKKIRIEFPAGDFDLSLEKEDLFNVLKDHFPNETLWENYSNWKESALKYQKLWGDLVKIGSSKAEKVTGFKCTADRTEGLAACFVSSALWYSIDLRKECMDIEKKDLAEQKEEEFIPTVAQLYKVRKIGASGLCTLKFAPDKRDIAWGNISSISTYAKVHHTLITAFCKNPEVIDLANLRMKLTNLESQLSHELRLALLKRSYISYICEFCPVQAFRTEEM